MLYPKRFPWEYADNEMNCRALKRCTRWRTRIYRITLESSANSSLAVDRREARLAMLVCLSGDIADFSTFLSQCGIAPWGGEKFSLLSCYLFPKICKTRTRKRFFFLDLKSMER